MALKYHVVASTSELEATPQMHVDLNGQEILLCRDGASYFAVSYYCSHEAFTLEGGMIKDSCITCPYHGAEFNLRTGEALTAPAYESIKTFPTRVEEDVISIAIDQ